MSDRCDECGHYLKYQGWSSYETWAVALWIDNDEGMLDWAREIAKSMAQADRSAADCGMGIKHWLEEEVYGEIINKLGASGMPSDIWLSAGQNVDWPEIGQHYLDVVREEKEIEA